MVQQGAEIACVGQRDLTRSQATYVESIGMYYAEQGCIIRSGNAKGSDQAFAAGANLVDPSRVKLYLPWNSFEKKAIITDPDPGYTSCRRGNQVVLADAATQEQRQYAAWAHPQWDRLSTPVQKLLIRNAMIIWEAWLVVAHPDVTKEGWGRTGHGIRVAGLLNKPVYICNRELQRSWDPSEGTNARPIG